MNDGLFDLPDGHTEPESPTSAGERRKRLIAARIARGEHPLGNLRILPGLHGRTCGDCEHRRGVGHHDKTYPKCCFPMTVGDKTSYPRVSHSDATDCRAWWPACTDYQPREVTPDA